MILKLSTKFLVFKYDFEMNRLNSKIERLSDTVENETKWHVRMQILDRISDLSLICDEIERKKRMLVNKKFKRSLNPSLY